jgi:hypothetical protein
MKSGINDECIEDNVSDVGIRDYCRENDPWGV